MVCRNCHADSGRGAEGHQEQLNLSAAMHGFHAVYLDPTDDKNCLFCHGGNGIDDLHTTLGLECVNCHGSLAEHAVSLLKEEKKPAAARLLDILVEERHEAEVSIKPRKPWSMEPDCLACHVDFHPPEVSSSVNGWTADDQGLFAHQHGQDGVLLCASCHGSAHALYPNSSSSGQAAGNLQPLQYQNNRYPLGADRGCAVCHTVDMEDEVHHPGSLGIFRNRVE